MVELWLIRHGQTDWNVEGRFQGSADVPLNNNGCAQAKRLADKVNGHTFAAVYSSHLKRANKTAQVLADALNLSVIVDDRLREISQGEWEGILFTDIKEQYPNEIVERKTNPQQFRPPGGETVEEVAQRVLQAVNEIAEKYSGKRVLIVSHGLALSTLICLAKDLPLSEAYEHIPDNAEPYVIQWDEKKVYEKVLNGFNRSKQYP